MRIDMRILKQAAWLLLVALLPAALAAWLHPQVPAWSREAAGAPEVTPEQVRHWSGPIVPVDARSESAFQTRHVPGAVLLNEDRWDDLLPGFLAVWTPEARVVVYCDENCHLSQEVARRLMREMGLRNVHVLKGGLAAWPR